MYKLELKNIKKSYKDKDIIRGLSLSVKSGEKISILGPSGCGKTTLLGIISGIKGDFNGSIFLDGKDITNLPTNKRNIVVVSQDNLLFPHMNVFDNIGFGLDVRKYSNEDKIKKVKELLDEIGLSGYENKKINKLSGGEKQRVALARALCVDPDILLLDEAYSSLDTKLREKMRELTMRLQSKKNLTTILVTHDKEEAILFSDRVAVMLDGSIRQIDSPQEVYDHPLNLDIAKFMMSDNFIDMKYLKNVVESDKRGVVFVKPEDVIINDKDDRVNNLEENKKLDELNKKLIDCKICGKVYSGSKIRYSVDIGDNRIIYSDDYMRKEFSIGDNKKIYFRKFNFYLED